MKLSIQALLLWVISIQHLSTKTFAHLTTNTFECESSLYDLPRELDTITTKAGFPLEMKHIYATIVGLNGGWTEGLKLYETPIVIRFTRLIDIMNWNCAAVYSVQWKDALTKTDPIIRAPEEININGKETISLHNSDTRLLCMVNAWATVVEDWVSEAAQPVLGIISDFKYPGVSNGYSDSVNTCLSNHGETGNDHYLQKECLLVLAESNCYSPSIMGKIIGHQITEYARDDGWNMYGQLNSDGTPCKTNCIRYTDPTGYTPQSQRRSKKGSKSRQRWAPLQEDNGRGYMTQQVR